MLHRVGFAAALAAAVGSVGLVAWAAWAAGTARAPQAPQAADVVNLYSYRQPYLIQPLIDAFTEQTGIAVNLVYARQGLLERLRAEGANSPADAVITSDIGRLSDLAEADLLQPISSPRLSRAVPEHLRHPDGLWYALTTRARVIYASIERVAPGEITTYEGLADPKWKGRICTRSGKHVYTVALIASMIVHLGEPAAEAWLRGVKANLARRPQGNDRAQVRAIAQGVCDLALGNTYYMGKMMQDPKQKAWAESVTIVFPNQQDRGTHVNISGAAVTRSAKHAAAAIRLIEFLASPAAQAIYAAENFEYPVLAATPLDPVVAGWGAFKADRIAISEVAAHRAAAMRLVDRVGFDF